MIKITGKYDPEPADIILSYTGAGTVDYFEGMDRLAVLDRLEAVGKHYALNWAVSLLVLGAVVTLACVLINWIMGYPLGIESGAVLLLAIPFLAGTNVILGIHWVLGAYRDALQVRLNE